MLNKTFFAAAALSVVAGSALVACGGSDDISVATPTPLAEPFTIEVMGFNDYHGTLESPGTFGGTTAAPAASRPVVGGAEFMAAYIASLKILTFRSSPSLLKFSIGSARCVDEKLEPQGKGVNLGLDAQELELEHRVNGHESRG